MSIFLFPTRWTREHLLPRCRNNVCFSAVTVGYWAKPCLMRRSTVDKPRLVYFWFCCHLPRFVTVFTRLKNSLQESKYKTKVNISRENTGCLGVWSRWRLFECNNYYDNVIKPHNSVLQISKKMFVDVISIVQLSTIIALILDESQRECLKSLYRSQWTRLNLLWVEASGTNPFFSLGVAESRHQNRRLSPGLWRWKLLREWTLPGWIGRMPWCKISHALLSRISPSWGEDEWNLFKKSISTQAASLSHLAYYYL